MSSSFIISIIAITILLYLCVINYNYYNKNTNKKENFYPLMGWDSGRWGIHKSYLKDFGNWRPYNYYPAYSGYWKECPSGSWCPPYVSCRDPACQ